MEKKTIAGLPGHGTDNINFDGIFSPGELEAIKFLSSENIEIEQFNPPQNKRQTERLDRLRNADTPQKYRSIAWLLIMHSTDGAEFLYIDFDRFADPQSFLRLALFAVERNGLAIDHISRGYFSDEDYYRLVIRAYQQNPESANHVKLAEDELPFLKKPE